ncbi:MAG: hypothetical protein Q8J78_04410 [Moraxellaceae bacterium]|nr:hypothetical protein [Moraxellaceae bacterium]
MKHSLPFVLLTSLLPAVAFPHGFGIAKGTHLDAALSTTWRSEAAANTAQAWQIPGLLMGGHALPAERGPGLDQAILTLTHHRDDGLYALLKAGSHDGGDFGLEHAYAGWRSSGESTGFAVEGGRMSPMFSPLLHDHPAERLYAESSLLADAFWGRHLEDNGLRLLARLPADIRLGIESWQGNAFPATPGETLHDVFGDITFATGGVTLTAGFFALEASAVNRTDNRYDSGHSHGGTTITVPDVRYTGDTRIGGVNGRLQWQLTDQQTLRLRSEWMQQDVDGNIRESTRLAHLAGTHRGMSHAFEFKAGRHEIGLRYDSLSLSNTVSGSGAAVLAPLAGLTTTGNNPQKLNVAYARQILPGLKTRIEWVQDDSTGQRHERWLLGFVWQEQLWMRH